MAYRPGNPDFEAEFAKQMTAQIQKPRLREWPWVLAYLTLACIILLAIYNAGSLYLKYRYG